MRILWHRTFLVLTILGAVIVISGCRKSLHEAVESCDLKTIQRLIDNGADVNARDEDGQTPLHRAALTGRKDVVNLLLAKGADINAGQKSGWTPLHQTAMNSWLLHGVAELLILRGADVHARTIDDITPLHAAAAGGHKDTVKLLIEKGADVNAKDKFGQTPLCWTAMRCKHNQRQIAELLLTAGAKVMTKRSSPLEYALDRGNQTVAHLMVEAIDLNGRDESGETPLHWAVRRKNAKLVEMFIQHGANVNAKSKGGNTPL
ncbi:MAG: ankyrin repeat domain-containing protein, partial [Planctomycetota bacterium]